MTPIERDSRKGITGEGFEWGRDTIEAEIREPVRGMIEAAVEEEMESAPGAGRSWSYPFRYPIRNLVSAEDWSCPISVDGLRLG